MASRYKDAGLEVFLMPFQSDNPLYTNYTALLDQTRKLVRERQIQLIHAHQIAGLRWQRKFGRNCWFPWSLQYTVCFTLAGVCKASSTAVPTLSR